MPTWKALPILSSDALSSVAYGTQEILLELGTVGVIAFYYALPIALAILLLIGVLIISYRQVIEAYPEGGGAYKVATKNLGPAWGRLTGVSLMIDYPLTVAVSISAGVQAITSAFPASIPYIIPLTIILVWIMVWINLRGTSESGTIFALPTYLFILCMLLLIGKGVFQIATGGVHVASTLKAPTVIPAGLTLFVLLRAFSSGCSAVTGIEAISDAVPHFRSPSARNAKSTLLRLGILLSVIFGGITVLSLAFGIHPDPTGNTSVLSLVTEKVFGRNWVYFVTQIATMMILTFAANTSFNGFPILASIMAQDKNFPRMFKNRGDRLSFHYGIITLGILSSFLLFVFHGKTDNLIPLYAIGVFLSFTLAQSGLVRKWWRERNKGWRRRLVVNGIGAVITFIVLMIFSVTKFLSGAWMVVVLTPILLIAITKIQRHYDSVASELRIDLDDPLPQRGSVIIVPVAGIHRVVAETIAFAQTLSPNVVAFYIAFSDEEVHRMEEKWEQWNKGVRLVSFVSRYRTIVRPLIEFVERIESRRSGTETVMVLLPQFVPKKWWQRLLHNQSAWRIRSILLAKKDVVVATVPYHLHEVKVAPGETHFK